MKRKGELFDIFIVLILIFVVFIFFAGFLYGYNLLTNGILNTVQTSSSINITQPAQQTFGQVNQGLASLRWLSLVIVVSMIISIMVSNFLVKAHPVFFIVYLLIVVVGIVLSVYLSNAYESILTSSNALTETLQSFTAMNFIMLHLPIWATIIGIMGAIFLFIGVTVDREQGGSIPV